MKGMEELKKEGKDRGRDGRRETTETGKREKKKSKKRSREHRRGTKEREGKSCTMGRREENRKGEGKGMRRRG